MTKAQKAIDDWIGDLQRMLEAHSKEAPNEACRQLVDILVAETYEWPEYPGLDA